MESFDKGNSLNRKKKKEKSFPSSVGLLSPNNEFIQKLIAFYLFVFIECA